MQQSKLYGQTERSKDIKYNSKDVLSICFLLSACTRIFDVKGNDCQLVSYGFIAIVHLNCMNSTYKCIRYDIL